MRTYGSPPYRIAVLHGGPGAAGSAAGLARGIATFASVLEPFQCADSIRGQITELRDQLVTHAAPPLVIAGWSWGAMLACLFATEHPPMVAKLILVAVPPFDEENAARITPERLRRLSESERRSVAALPLLEVARLFERIDSFDAVPHDPDEIHADATIHDRVWGEAAELRRSGDLLRIAAAITCPVTIFHGDSDPHPLDGARLVASTIRNAKLVTLERCGHTPWIERHARDPFFRALRAETESAL